MIVNLVLLWKPMSVLRPGQVKVIFVFLQKGNKNHFHFFIDAEMTPLKAISIFVISYCFVSFHAVFSNFSFYLQIICKETNGGKFVIFLSFPARLSTDHVCQKITFPPPPLQPTNANSSERTKFCVEVKQFVQSISFSDFRIVQTRNCE